MDEWLGGSSWHQPKSVIIKTSSESIGSATPGTTFATISHPNPIKTVNSTISMAGSVYHSKLVPFMVPMAFIILATRSDKPLILLQI